MGVNGLWTVVQPCARPTNLGTLNRKRLAVDASIWIYQFLKAVRDKEGNALRNSHVVGFFRRICKLLWFGIQPVFVFDGGAPALKRATIQARKRRREGRREDAVRTAGKLLAVQMQRLAKEQEEERRSGAERGASHREALEQHEQIPDAGKLVYVDEIGMSQREREHTRRFHKQDAYHLPELEGGIAAMGKPDDPRIMSVEELEEYARQFNSGEDVNLYDFSKIDFDGDFFKSLPPADRYNIINAARLRSRLRMGYSKEQLDEMFPDRMAFSRFQIERVKERNQLTQRLMYEVGMAGTDLTIGVNARVAGEKDREYILVKNEGVEGGWALGVVSKDKDVGEAHKPIDVDAIEFQYQSKNLEEEEEADFDFEDVPIEGINRLPRPMLDRAAGEHAAQAMAERRERLYQSKNDSITACEGMAGEGSLFVGDGVFDDVEAAKQDHLTEPLHAEEQYDINRAIALSLQSQYGVEQPDSDGEAELEDVNIPEPKWTQKSVEAPGPLRAHSGSVVARIVNNRASAAVPRRQELQEPAGSESDEDMKAVMARSRKMKKLQQKEAASGNPKKTLFNGPLPFPKLNWKASMFAKPTSQRQDGTAEITTVHAEDGVDDGEAGGFETPQREQDGLKPLPPWLADETDIREGLKRQHDIEREMNAEDKAEAQEEERLRRRERRDRMIEIESSSSSSSDDGGVEIIEAPASPKKVSEHAYTLAQESSTAKATSNGSSAQATPHRNESVPWASDEDESWEKSELGELHRVSPEDSNDHQLSTKMAPASAAESPAADTKDLSPSPEPEFEDVPPIVTKAWPEAASAASAAQPMFEDSVAAPPADYGTVGPAGERDEDDLFAEVEDDEFSEPGDEELLAQMAEEAEEHARFASELNQKSAQQNRDDYEKELRALRTQQKKDRRDADDVTQVMVTECQSLLRLFGIPYVTAPMEAEAQCAELVSLGLVDGIVTDDSDIFLFGGTRIYKNMFNSNKFVECYLAKDIDKELSLSRAQLISLAQLLGSDYTEGLPGIGPVTAVEILSEFPGKSGLEDFREWWKGVQSQSRPLEADAPSAFRKKFRKSQATKLFLPPSFPNPVVYDAYLHPEVDASTEGFQWGVPDLEGLREFLMATIGWSRERTDEVLVPVIKDMNRRDVEGTQSNITRFYGGGVGAGAKEAFAPRQRAQGSKRMAAAVDKLRTKVSGEGGPGSRALSNKRRRTNNASRE